MLKNSQEKSIITIVMFMVLVLINFMIVPSLQANMTEIQSNELQNIETQDTEIQSTITYTYDSLGRLISDTTDQVSTNKYDYDPVGNRLSTSTKQQK
ncbi:MULTISPECIES: hypothetical protein [Xenorhabdus]|uniref:hypothetical protein n=1 Tax=Xenorhabdus TaxID=626 RepID=UPI0006478D4A|nr:MULTISPECIES: hypothetical protein [Xenorhabdus]